MGEAAEYIQAVVRCAEEIELVGGLTKYPNTATGRDSLARFQRSIYEKGFNTPEPTFAEGEGDPPDAALPVKGFRSEHKARIAGLWDDAIVAIAATEGAERPKAKETPSAPKGAERAAPAALAVAAKAMPRKGEGKGQAPAESARKGAGRTRQRSQWSDAQWAEWTRWAVWSATAGWSCEAEAHEVDQCPVHENEGNREFELMLLILAGVLTCLLAICSMGFCCVGYYYCRGRWQGSASRITILTSTLSAREGAAVTG